MRGLVERRGQLPPAVDALPDLIQQGEIVGHPDFELPIAVQVDQANGEGLGLPVQHLRRPMVALLEIDDDACLLVLRRILDAVLLQFGGVGRRHQVERAVAVQVAPRHGIRVVVDPGQGSAFEAGACAGRALVMPVRDAVQPAMGEGDIERAVPVDIDDGDAARKAVVERLAGEGEVAVVPQDRALAVDAGEDQVQVAVIVEIVGRHAGAIADVGSDLAQARAGRKVKVVGHEGSSAGRRLLQFGRSHIGQGARTLVE